jgi:chromosomal replication initiator protein
MNKLTTIISSVCEAFDVTASDLMSSKRTKAITTARQAAYYIAWRHSMKSSVEIGKFLGKHHTSVIYGARNTELHMRLDERLAETVRGIEAGLQS